MGHIVDISKWNGNIDWSVAALRLDLVMPRVQMGQIKVAQLNKDTVKAMKIIKNST